MRMTFIAVIKCGLVPNYRLKERKLSTCNKYALLVSYVIIAELLGFNSLQAASA